MTPDDKGIYIRGQLHKMFDLYFNCRCDKKTKRLFYSSNGFIPSFWKKIQRFGHMNYRHRQVEDVSYLGYEIRNSDSDN